MKASRIYLATLIGPVITGILFILIDGLKSGDLISYLNREAKHTWMFIATGLIITCIGIKFFSRNLRNQNTEIYIYWAILYSLVLVSLYILEIGRVTFIHGLPSKDALIAIIAILGITFIPFLILGFVIGLLYTPLIKFMLNEPRQI